MFDSVKPAEHQAHVKPAADIKPVKQEAGTGGGSGSGSGLTTPPAPVEAKTSKAATIKALIKAKTDAGEEVKIGEIAKAVGVKYQYVYAIVHPEVSEKARAKQAEKKKAAKAAEKQPVAA